MKKLDDFTFDMTENRDEDLRVPDFPHKYKDWSWYEDDLFRQIEGLTESLEDAVAKAKAESVRLSVEAYYAGFAKGVKRSVISFSHAGQPIWVTGEDDQASLIERQPWVRFIFPYGDTLYMDEVEEATVTVKSKDGKTFTRSLLTGAKK